VGSPENGMVAGNRPAEPEKKKKKYSGNIA